MLEVLPLEIWQLVLSFLPTDFLPISARVCRTWRKLVDKIYQEPWLACEKFRWDNEKKGKDLEISGDGFIITRNRFRSSTLWQVARADVGFSEGIHYWEIKIDSINDVDTNTWRICIGIIDESSNCVENNNLCWAGGTGSSWGLAAMTKKFIRGGKMTTMQHSFESTDLAAGDRFGIFLDLEKCKIWFNKNGLPFQLGHEDLILTYCTKVYPTITFSERHSASIVTNVVLSKLDRIRLFPRDKKVGEELPKTPSVLDKVKKQSVAEKLKSWAKKKK